MDIKDLAERIFKSPQDSLVIVTLQQYDDLVDYLVDKKKVFFAQKEYYFKTNKSAWVFAYTGRTYIVPLPDDDGSPRQNPDIRDILNEEHIDLRRN